MSTLTVKILGAALLLGMVGTVVLAALEQPVPDPLALVTVSAVTGLLGLLAPIPGQLEPPVEVQATLEVDDRR